MSEQEQMSEQDHVVAAELVKRLSEALAQFAMERPGYAVPTFDVNVATPAGGTISLECSLRPKRAPEVMHAEVMLDGPEIHFWAEGESPDDV